MKSNRYLYGDVIVPEIPEWIKEKRIDALQKNLDRVLDKPARDVDWVKVKDINDAIDFWRSL